MTTACGFAIGVQDVRAVVVRSGVVRWHGAEPHDDARRLSTAIAALVARMPKSAAGARTVVAIGPAWCQVKPLYGLPNLKQPALIDQLVRENHQAFFLSTGTPLVVAEVHHGRDGTPWGATFDRAVLDEVVRALRAARMKIVCAVPSVVAIAANVGHDQVEWRDGRQAFAIAGENGHVCRIDRIMAPAVDRANDDDAERYIDARAATAMRPNGPLCWRPAVDASRAHWRTRLRLGLESVCLAAAGLFALAGRGYRAERFARHARVELARAEDRRSALARDQAELRRITQTLARIEAFRGERGRVSSVLGELSEAIPESTAVLTFHVDSVDGSFAAIAAQVADVLPELQGMSEIVAPRIVGSVTREVIGGVRVERASFRFRRPGRRTVSLARAERRAP